MLNKLATSILILFTIVGTVSAQSPLLLGKLAVYYGFPSAVNGAGGDLDAAAAVFSDYDIVIFGDSLQYPQYDPDNPEHNPWYGCDQNSHFDHDNTVGIISRLNSAGTAVYGYISIGGENTAWICDGIPAPHSMAEIKSRIDVWADMGVAGIFLDEAEYGFGCSRERQNETVDYVHSKGLPVFINAWNPDEVFGSEVVSKITYTTGSLDGQESTVEMNPNGAPTHLGSDDIYMMESFQIINGNYRPPVDWAIRSDKALSYKNQFGTRVATLTTPTPDQNFGQLEQAQLDYAWWSTLLYGFDYMGWGEANDYSSWGPYADKIYNRQRPDPGEIGSLFTSASVTHVGDLHTRTTTAGTIEVNSQTHTGRFIRDAVNGIYVWTDETSTEQDRQNLVDVCADPSHPLGMVLLSNYKSGEYLSMWPAANLHAFNTLAHQAGLSVYALYTNKDWIDEVVQYNAECTDPIQRFDGYAMDFEGPWPGGGSEPSTAADIQYYADAKAASGTLPLHVSIGWHWDNDILYNSQTKPAYQHISDLVNSVDVQTVFETADEIEFRATDEVSYANQINKPVFPTIETQDVSGLGMSEWNTFYEEGEAAMWNELAAVDFGTAFTGFILHYYKYAYSSGTELWPSHAVPPSNTPPIVGVINAPLDPVLVDTVVSASASFSDADVDDIHTAIWDWGDGNTSSGIVDESTKSVTGSHSYGTPGVYTVTLTVSDSANNYDEGVFEFVVVYDPDGGFVTGGGWINSPAEAYTPDPTLTGKANFGFNSKYKKGADVPTGQTEFRFKVADLNFHSTSYQWLVVSGPNAKFKGDGAINGEGDYGFMLTAVDGDINGGGGIDKFRIKIWNKANDEVVYDNKKTAGDDSYDGTELGGGSIVIHEGKDLPAPAKPVNPTRMVYKIPAKTELLRNYPNPFNPETWIPYQLATDSSVNISIYNAKGKLIRALHVGNQNAGVYVTKEQAAYWDGKDSFGEKVASGVYFYTLYVRPVFVGAGEFRATKKMVILK